MRLIKGVDILVKGIDILVKGIDEIDKRCWWDW